MLEGATCPHKPTVLCGWSHVQVLGEFDDIDAPMLKHGKTLQQPHERNRKHI